MGLFLDYQSILRKLPAYWKTKINQNNFICKNMKQYVARNCYLKLLCKDKKGSRTLYDIIVGNQDSSPPSQKWVNILGNITQEEWNSYNETHNENMPIQMYRKFHLQKMKIFR